MKELIYKSSVIEVYRLPARGEEPSQELIDILGENPDPWEGDDEGVVFSHDRLPSRSNTGGTFVRSRINENDGWFYYGNYSESI